MAVAAPTQLKRLLAAAAAARDSAVAARREAVAASWRASGARLVARDLRAELAWSIYQNLRYQDGLRPTTTLLRHCRQPNCRLDYCGRPYA